MLFILCGIPGSGKTTLSKQLAEQHNAKLHCFDSLPNAHHPKYYQAVRQQMHESIAEDLRNGYSVVCDDLNTRIEWRSAILSAVADIPCRKILMVMTTPLDECLRRNANRKARLPDCVVVGNHDKYEPPSISEGWDEIQYI